MAKRILTNEDKLRLETELRELIDVKKPEIIKQLKEARAQGDLSENADYDAAKTEQGNIEKRIAEITDILSNYELIDNKNKSDVIVIGSNVKLKNLSNNQIYEYHIVGTEGANPKENKISNDCPLARSIMHKKTGDIVEVKGIETPYKVEILSFY